MASSPENRSIIAYRAKRRGGFRAPVERSQLHRRNRSHYPGIFLATHLIEGGRDIPTVQELLGDDDLSTTMFALTVLIVEGLA